MLVEAAVVLERALVDRQPHQGGGTTMVSDQRHHDGRLFVGVEVGPVQCHYDGFACADDVGHPANEYIVDVDHRVGEQAIHLFRSMLGVQATCGR